VSQNSRDVARSLGSYQADAFQGHFHAGTTGGSTNEGFQSWRGPIFSTKDTTSRKIAGAPVDGDNGVIRVANETRSKNIALLYCMKQ